MPVLYTTEAVSSGDGRNGEVRSTDGVLDELLAVPKEMGGPGGEKTNPEQLFAAGYAACFHNGLRLIASERKVRVADSTVTSTVSLLALDDARFTLAVELHAHLPGLDQTTADELVQATHQVCPYSNVTRGNIEVALKTTI
ncbi:organic hydroperoxide resistance protein [Streptantibioticus ferralitis]|uniref:Organic hydroperoxide resistance protein n=1 Tax=Streptantibioticus ferralitis TaxID=236510 RepID=A0ABT5YTK2_9ACTN|nr:organic hydroperoxide resistance protein [Streptantibioticus ferralitis]MDF2254818.1 organic hydroperoxide resistance protein [Streptantibioticus ferralitis]